jgi:hypothetical protein
VSIVAFILSILSMLYVFIKQSVANKKRLNAYKKRIKDLEKELLDLKSK